MKSIMNFKIKSYGTTLKNVLCVLNIINYSKLFFDKRFTITNNE